MAAGRLRGVISSLAKPSAFVRNVLKIDVKDRQFVVFTSIVVYLGISVTYNLLQYQTLGTARVAVAALLFVGLFASFFVLSRRGESWTIRRPRNPWAGLWVGFLVLFAWMSSFPRGARFQEYYPAFPLNSIDSGGAIGRDTLFHETLIQSIMNFGYPSSGLNDVPLVVYHTLSHYAESAILLVSGLEPLDSAGLFFRLKVVLIVASLVVLLDTATKNRSFATFLVSIIIAIPALTSRWLITWSLALWMTTFILIATAAFTHRVITSATRPSGRDVTFLGVIGIALCLGKISSGMIYILVVGMHLLVSHFRDKRIYLLGTGWLVFLVGYGSWFAHDRAITPPGTEFSLWSWIKSVAHLLLLRGRFAEYVQDIYVLGGVIIIFWFLYRTRTAAALVLSLAAGFSAICALQFIQMNDHDIRYFTQALSFVVLLFLVLEILAILPTTAVTPTISNSALRRWASVIFVGVLAVAITGLGRAPLDVFTARSASIVKPFETRAAPLPENSPRLEEFRTHLNSFMEEKGLTKRNSLLFISAEIWSDLSSKLSESKSLVTKVSWSHPFAIYAATGVPLLNGVVAWEVAYGFSAYSERGGVIPAAQLEKSDPCRFGKTIIVVSTWHPATFTTKCGVPRG